MDVSMGKKSILFKKIWQRERQVQTIACCSQGIYVGCHHNIMWQGVPQAMCKVEGLQLCAAV